MSSVEQAIKFVEATLNSLDIELYKYPDPRIKHIPRIQKEVFRQKLKEIYEILSSGDLPERSQRNLGLSRAIVDSWPFNSKLGEEIVRAEIAFIEAK